MTGNQMQLEDWLDDLCVRFIINLPQEDLSSVARICFQVEEAQWFYEDFIRPLDPNLPSMSLRTFCLRIFQHCPLLASFSVENHTKAFEEFLEYKTRVPVRGAIMLNHAMDSVVLVKGWKKGANWSFPRGKINKDEPDLDCAVREVWEETGLDLQAADLVPTETKPKYIEILMREQQLRLYVFRDVPMDTDFHPRTRKEISKIQWYKLSELPAFRKKGVQNQNDAGAGSNANKFYMVAPFLVPLKKWIASQKKVDERRMISGSYSNMHHHLTAEEAGTTEDDMYAPRPADTASQTPGIETLDGATRELQRLLKMQPPTQGLQPPAPQEDKGSALLSILQAGGSGAAKSAGPGGHVPQTPIDHTVVEPPQPYNPHHHSNQHGMPVNVHQPPPSFPLAQSHGSTPGAFYQGFPHNQARVPQQAAPGYAGMPPQQASNRQVSLVHPQPLPPQVQRAVFNKSAFQEGGGQNLQMPQMGQNQNPEARAGYNQSHQTIPQQRGPVQRADPAPLNGQSMALLNAFKRDAAPAAPIASTAAAQMNSNEGSRPVVDLGQKYPSYGQHLPPQIPQAVPQNTSRPASNQGPTELAGSAVGPPADQHRSALLGMFKKPDAATSPAQNPVVAAPANQPRGEMPRHLSQQASGGHALSGHMHNLSIQGQVPKPPSVGRENTAPSWQHHGGFAADSRAPQPARTHQHGQGGQHMNMAGEPAASPRAPEAYGAHHQPRPEYMGTPPTGQAMPSPGEQYVRPGASKDQKRQLLSLFGKQPSPAGDAAHPGGHPEQAPRMTPLATGGSDQAYGSGASSHRGRETPISPADQSFLLDYLQSVTNKASR